MKKCCFTACEKWFSSYVEGTTTTTFSQPVKKPLVSQDFHRVVVSKAFCMASFLNYLKIHMNSVNFVCCQTLSTAELGHHTKKIE